MKMPNMELLCWIVFKPGTDEFCEFEDIKYQRFRDMIGMEAFTEGQLFHFVVRFR